MELFQKGQIGTLQTKNRMVMLPIGARFAEHGYINQRVLDYYEERAKGGVGLLIVEVSSVESPRGNPLANEISIDDDKFLPGLSELAHIIKSHGVRAAIQIGHAGNAGRIVITGQQPIAPSAVKKYGDYDMPRAMEIAEIEEMVERFRCAAERAQRAGFDGIEIHAAHLYLINQFLSRAWNKRTDKYGGNLQKRMRFLLEIIAAIRGTLGRDYPLWCRINSKEVDIPDGITLEESKQIAQAVQGQLDAISVSICASGALAFATGSPNIPGALLPLAKEIKSAVGIPIIAAGNITPELGNKAIREGTADFIGIARGLICDADMPHKIIEGRINEIRPCISCYNCYKDKDPLTCSVNPTVGRERESGIARANNPKKILVIGSGPAGMQAAIVAAQKGHDVTLCDENKELGGQLIAASIPPNKNRLIGPLTNYFKTQIGKLPIKTQLGKKVTVKAIIEAKPDVVVLATGMISMVPEIPGIDKPNVVQAMDVLMGKKDVGQKVVIIGGELVGCETADFLSEKGKEVVVVRRGPRMAMKMHISPRRVLIDRLVEKGVLRIPDVQYNEINDKGLIITTKAGERRLIEADNIVLAAGAKPNNALLDTIKKKTNAIILVAGDCLEPRSIREAIYEGFWEVHDL
ncbi:MAG: FAD-dependent oxidoreductase [Dehalococcoidia bacterium]|jgi:2,4-dienoyl-CoA reductase-like NADH-dependent reductase (Old Yellow Enzyme family)/thioredoxin reductase